MRLFLAMSNPQNLVWASKTAMPLRILLSYHYYKDVDLDALFAKYFTPPYPDVFGDSGAFSAFTQGVTIDLRDYAAWLKRWRHLFFVYANLDVIGDPDGTRTNQERLEGVGLTPIPVFHTGENWSYLDHYLDHYAYIALGGMVPYMRFPNRIMPWIVQAFKRANGCAVFHGFGATAWRVIRDLPWYSVDSSSWSKGFRYGEVPIFDAHRGTFVKLGLGDRAAWTKHRDLVRSLGFNPNDFADREKNDRAKIGAISASSYMRAEQWLRQRHGEVRIPGQSKSNVSQDSSTGLKMYLQDGGNDTFKFVG